MQNRPLSTHAHPEPASNYIISTFQPSCPTSCFLLLLFFFGFQGKRIDNTRGFRLDIPLDSQDLIVDTLIASSATGRAVRINYDT